MPIIIKPQGQKRLTNVAILKYRSHGKRFEVAAYKNKVLNWREGIEKDLNEVLQVVTVFTNVSKGDVANDADLKKAFGTNNQEEVCRKILKSGELQVSDRERETNLEGLFRDIVQSVVERCVHPQSGRQLTATTVESALKATGISVKADQTAKKQALKAIEQLCADMPDSFARAKMRLRMNCPKDFREEVRRCLTETAQAQIEEEAAIEGDLAFTFVCGPQHYRELDRFCTVTHRGEGLSMQVITATVLGEAAVTVAAEADRATGSTAAGVNFTVASSPQHDSRSPFICSVARPGVVVSPATPAPAGYPAGRGSPAPQAEAASADAPKRTFKCSTCAAEFDDSAEYRTHCRCDWHNFNLKRKVKTLAPVSHEEFIEISLDTAEGFRAVDM